jgi:hypothetical protein
VGRFAEVERVVETLARGQWQWVLGACLLQGGFFLVSTAVYHSAFDTVAVRSRVVELLPIWFASIWVNVAVPTAGPATFLDDAVRRGESAARAAAGIILVRVADFVTFMLVLVAGLAYLFTRHDLRAYQVITAAVLLLITGGWTTVLVLGVWRPALLRCLLQAVERTGNRMAVLLRRPAALSMGWAERSASEFAAASEGIAARPWRLARTLGLALAAHVIDLATLQALFLAFHQPVGLGVLVAGFAMGVLFWIVSITPEGIGIVEGMMALVYTSLGIPPTRATVIALAFRGLTFWLPLLAGFFFLRRIGSLRPEEG